METDALIKKIIETGKIDFGSNKALKNIKKGKAKAIILSKNCPKKIRQDIEYYAKIEKIPLIVFPGTSLQLGEVCGKPFTISSITITDLGRISLSELTE